VPARRDRPVLHKKYGGSWQKIPKTCTKSLHGTVKIRLTSGCVWFLCSVEESVSNVQEKV
jgi:hypothetical protein